MAKKIPFTKMVASGNDFVVVDNRRNIVKNPLAFTKKVCKLHHGVGADGVLLVEKSRKGAFKMRIVNSDGSEAEACGNGFRCIALYAHKKLGLGKSFSFESKSGTIQARIKGKRIQVQLARPKDYRSRESIEVLGNRLNYSFINTGVPHAVVFVNGLNNIDVAAIGRAIREHTKFRPSGTNVNFVEVQSRSKIRVRTYERGVEAETLACGTGSSASAITSSLQGFTKAPVNVLTSGGEVLTIGFKKTNGRAQQVTLEGEANFVFEGVLS